MGMTDPDASELESLVADAQKVEPLGDRAPRLYALVFLSSLALNYSLYCLLALVSHITQFYSARTYEVVVGLLYVSALPMAALQLGFDRAYDLKYRSATAFAFRLGVCYLLLAAASAGLAANQLYGVLLGMASVIGAATWLAAGVVAAICGLLSSDAFVWMGVGFQARARESLSCPFALLM